MQDRSGATSWEYIRDLFRPDDRLAVVIKHENKSGVFQRIATAELVAAPRFQAWLRFENAHGGNIYVGMNPLKPDARGRTKQEIDIVRHVFLDLDRNGSQILSQIQNDPNLPKLSYVVNTSIGKYQVIWSVEGFSAEAAERLQRAMALAYDADRAATDVARVLRIPGFNNWKYDPPYRVTAQKLSETVCIPSDFHVELRAEPLPWLQSASERPQLKPNHVSQSERDWAETLSRLENNEKPAAVQDWLRNKRQDKPNPDFYAALTVRKALAELERRRSPGMSIEHC